MKRQLIEYGCFLLVFMIWIPSSFVLIRNYERKIDTLQRRVDFLEHYIPTPMELQQRLNGTGNPRYDCGEVDGIAGNKLCKALNNMAVDRIAEEFMKGESYGY